MLGVRRGGGRMLPRSLDFVQRVCMSRWLLLCWCRGGTHTMHMLSWGLLSRVNVGRWHGQQWFVRDSLPSWILLCCVHAADPVPCWDVQHQQRFFHVRGDVPAVQRRTVWFDSGGRSGKHCGDLQWRVHRGLLLLAVVDYPVRWRRVHNRHRGRLPRDVRVRVWHHERASELLPGLLLPVWFDVCDADSMCVRCWYNVRPWVGVFDVCGCVRNRLLLSRIVRACGLHNVPRGFNVWRWPSCCVLHHDVPSGILLPPEHRDDGLRCGEIQHDYRSELIGDMS